MSRYRTTTRINEETGEVEQIDIPFTEEEEIERDAEEAQAIVNSASRALAVNLDDLWRAADGYTANYISGVAVGLLTLGAIQQLPKALAVVAWSSAVWDAYYTRKALVTATAPADLDFSSFGPIPYSVPELRAELGM